MISNISYNTPTYLKKKLDKLVDDGEINFYIFIFHKREDDELSDHIHLIMYPDKIVDTKKLEKEFIEFEIGEELPLGVSKKWKTVSKDCDLDWILYVLHDEIYCKAKCKGEKKYRYTSDEFVTNDIRTLKDLVFSAYHETEFYHDIEIQRLIKENNMSGADLIQNGYVPIKNACAYHHFTQMLQGG